MRKHERVAEMSANAQTAQLITVTAMLGHMIEKSK